MSELNFEDDIYNLEDNDSASKSMVSKQRKKGRISSSNIKKARRSRIIISDVNDFNENKREYYDPETKYKKCIQSAVAFNEFVNNSRRKMSKHFLKRKVKMAFEREPLEKVKGFCFNVPFIPNLSMFAQPSQTQGNPQSNVAQNRQIVNPNPRIENKVNISNIEEKTSSSGNINKNITNLSSGNISNINSNTNRHLFNVNQTASVDNKTKVVIENKNIISIQNSNNNIQSQNTSSMTFTQNYTAEQLEIIKIKQKQSQSVNQNLNQNVNQNMNQNVNQNMNQNVNHNPTPNSTPNPNPINNPNSDPNALEQLRQRQIKIKIYMEAYHKDPEKLKREMTPEDFMKLENFINMTKNREKMTNSNNNITNNVQVNQNQNRKNNIGNNTINYNQFRNPDSTN